MSRGNLEKVVGREYADQIIAEIGAGMGEVDRIEQVECGLVHYVYRVMTNSQTAYLKIRGNYYSGIPDISTQPELIAHEKKAIELFSERSAEFFPKILLYNSFLHYLLLSDVMPGGITLDRKYEQKRVSHDDLFYFGKTIGTIHSASQTAEPVRDPNDRQYQANLMEYTLESYQHPVLVKAAEEHKHRQTQLLIGDLSPKNTYIENGVVRLCDLENAHQGALPYDQAFVLAHILLHHDGKDVAIAAMWAFIDGYQEAGISVDEEDRLVGQTLQGILLYRLDNPVIPYDLAMSKSRRKQMVENVFSSLDQGNNDLEVITANVFKNRRKNA